MSQLPPQLQPLPTDVTFSNYRDSGDPGCLCSRCLLPIPEREVPIMFFPGHGQWVLRYHPGCLGIVTYSDKEDYQKLPY